MRKITISAPAKIHFSGEHSVVYGQPALLAAVNRYLKITLKAKKSKFIEIKTDNFFAKIRFSDLKVKAKENLLFFALKTIYEELKLDCQEGYNLSIVSAIPQGMGMGSSAALAVALTGAVLFFEKKIFYKKLINQIAYKIEKKQHLNPSGGDNTIITYGGLLKFQKVQNKFRFKKIKIKKNFPRFLLVNSGKPKENTGEMVKFVFSKLKSKNLKIKNKTEKIIKDLGMLTKKIINCFIKEDFSDLKVFLKQNEELLEDLGVVGNKARKIIHLLKKSGGAGKICGAGGIKKGSGMILAFHQDLDFLKQVLKKAKIDFIDIMLVEKGLQRQK